MSIINTVNIFIFLTTIFLMVIFLSIFKILDPEYNVPKYNFAPFPGVKPEDLDSSGLSKNTNCLDDFRQCDPGIGCGMCGDDKFQCTIVSANENVMVNGKKIGPGYWCLPSGKEEVGCGTYTGRAIWSEINGEQKWKCVCLYPDLFAGNDCNTQVACRDNSDPKYQYVDQRMNKLISSDGHVWDPSDPKFDTKGRTPYDKKSDGSPMYTCSCNPSSNLSYISLPSDPYRCHLNPCDPYHMNIVKSDGTNMNMWDENAKKCDCKKIQQGMYAHSNVTGQCLLAGPYCRGNAWDDDTQTCKCDADQGSSIATCKTDKMVRSSYTQGDCPPDNPVGSYCFNPCSKCNESPNTVGQVNGDKCDCNCLPNRQYGLDKTKNCAPYCLIRGPLSGEKVNKCCGKPIQECNKEPSASGYCDGKTHTVCV